MSGGGKKTLVIGLCTHITLLLGVIINDSEKCLPEKSTTYKYGSSYIRLSTQRALLTNLTTTYDPTGPVSPANLIPFVVAFDPTTPFLFNGAQAGGGLLGSPTVFDNVPSPEILISITSMCFKNSPKERHIPAGVPVAITSPGWRVIPIEQVTMRVGMSKISCDILAD